MKKRTSQGLAEELSLTQPAVSHHIALLEQDLGIKIFHRSKGELKLTAEGEIAIKYAKRIKALYEKMQQAISDEEKHMTKSGWESHIPRKAASSPRCSPNTEMQTPA